MKRLSYKMLSICFCVMFFAGLGMMNPVTASAGGIVAVHGHQGHIEYPDRVISDRQFLGWGLNFDQSSGAWNWIHYSIPVPLFSKTRYLGIKFSTGSVDVKISRFHVYDGYHRIFAADSLNLTEDTYKDDWYIIDMGADHVINSALGLSIQVGAGVEMMSHKIKIYAIAAEWH